MQEIKKLLQDNTLSHFEYDAENKRIIYTHDIGTVMQKEDFKRLIRLLDKNQIQYESIGMDVIFLL